MGTTRGDVDGPADDGGEQPDVSLDPFLIDWAAGLADRIRAGDAIDIEEIAQAYPDRAEMLRRLIPTIELMASLGSSKPTDAGKGRTPDAEPALGILGDFQLVRELGRGGMGIVYEARQLSLGGRRVALKILPAASALDPRQIRRFEVEAQAAASLDHEHIVPIYAVGRERGVPYYVMKLIEGRSLASVVRELRKLDPLGPIVDEGEAPVDEESDDVLASTLAYEMASGRLGPDESPGKATDNSAAIDPPPARVEAEGIGPSTGRRSSGSDRAYFRTVARLGIQAAEALHHAHLEGVLHRDVKPANLLVDGRGNLWITDFGLARLRGDSELTRTGDLIGTLRYMSPEQALGRRISVDQRTDVYSLGATLYELLTLRPAFGGDDRALILRRIAEEEPRPPRRLNRSIPRDLETIVLKAMAKDPSSRYASAGSLAEDLGRFWNGTPIRARRSPFWRRASSWVRSHRVTSTLIASALVILLIAASAWFGIRRIEVDSLIGRLESARLVDLIEIVPRLDLSDRSVVDRLGRLYADGDPAQKLAAALALAPIREDCKTHALDRCLDGEPDQLRILAPLLRGRIAEALESRLVEKRGTIPPIDPPSTFEADRRRANAECIRIILGQTDPEWSILEYSPDPQARSFFIGAIGPAGVDPARLIARLDDPSTSDPARAAIIQALEAVPAGEWPPRLRDATRMRLLKLYRDDPDSGVHGSAKWMLGRWGLAVDRSKIDEELKGTRADDARFRWRISREGLTFVTVEDPALGRVIEVSDAEITVEMYRRFRPDAEYSKEFSPEKSCPINGVSCIDAMEFCNWITKQEGIDPGQICYEGSGNEVPAILPKTGHLDLAGFRLPTGPEFDSFCSAGTRTRRYFGDSDLLLDRYAWTRLSPELGARPVAGKIPNDFGLFDTLGNIQEWCEARAPIDSDGRHTADLRGTWFGWSPPREVDRHSAFPNIYQDTRNPMNGFRVVRTKSVR
ncbi:protein kinase domain-containing protein [Tundrisphaera lichenicola]|uniref:protein kinase domain-containing protein n=1 Tax=Tundrisphaera lichenicola TaxID=2029860 RepID=UPI003EB73B18